MLLQRRWPPKQKEFDSAAISPAGGSRASVTTSRSSGVLVVQVDGAGCGTLVQSGTVSTASGRPQAGGRSWTWLQGGNVLGGRQVSCIAVASGRVTGGGAGGIALCTTVFGSMLPSSRASRNCAGCAESAAGVGCGDVVGVVVYTQFRSRRVYAMRAAIFFGFEDERCAASADGERRGRRRRRDAFSGASLQEEVPASWRMLPWAGVGSSGAAGDDVCLAAAEVIFGAELHSFGGEMRMRERRSVRVRLRFMETALRCR